MSLLRNQSRCRKLQYDWLATRAVKSTGRVLDLGGVRGADYHALLGLDLARVVVWNLAPDTNPDRLVNLDVPAAASLPMFPRECESVLALNLIEHLYHPFELLRWVCAGLPSGGRLYVTVPFLYSIHPSPNDFWRITPQAFERFFRELSEKEGVAGEARIEPLAVDLRDVIGPLTSPLFKAGALARVTAVLLESIAGVVSSLYRLLFGGVRLKKRWVETNPSAIGIEWVKN